MSELSIFSLRFCHIISLRTVYTIRLYDKPKWYDVVFFFNFFKMVFNLNVEFDNAFIIVVSSIGALI